MNGAEALIDVLSRQGVRVCFANPGTSEMHMVAALRGHERIRSVLCLFEGVCTGAADGFGRMSGGPAITLLHLGPGLANGVANLHNARRSGAPVVNIVGDHATYHARYDTPLTSNIEGIAGAVSAWVRSTRGADDLASDGRDAFVAALRARPAGAGNVSTLIVPADCAWSPARASEPIGVPERYLAIDGGAVAAIASEFGSRSALLLDGIGLTEPAIRIAGRISRRTGCRLLCPTFPARVDAARECAPLERLPYLPEQIVDALSNVRQLVLVGAEAPISFFAYQGMSSELAPSTCEVARLNHRHENGIQALEMLADALDVPGPTSDDAPMSCVRPETPEGPLTIAKIGQALAALAPDDSILCTDSGGGAAAFSAMQGAVSHTWLSLTGGAIGQGGPVALGASIACPERRVFALLGDGGAMYTVQYLWSAARERAKVISIILNNRSYGILDLEYRRIGAAGQVERRGGAFALEDPEVDWVSLANALGVPGARVTTCEALAREIQRALETPGPYLIDALL